LLLWLGKPRLLERVGKVRDAAAAALEKQGDAWNRARSEAASTRVEQQLHGGQLAEAFDGAEMLLDRARTAGEQAYPGALWVPTDLLVKIGSIEVGLIRGNLVAPNLKDGSSLDGDAPSCGRPVRAFAGIGAGQ
jgi:hypothetical protein